MSKLKAKTSLADQLNAVRQLIKRVLPRHDKPFILEPLPPTPTGRDVFELEGNTIRGTSGVAAAAGFHYYLRHFVRASVHWGRDRSGFNVDHLPSQLPPVATRVRKVASQQFRYYFNAVTFGYSSAWWTWERWEQEIDWAALHGVNLFLALEGQEYIWEQLWTEMGLSQEELEKYFPGPAFLAWHRMGNLDTFMGPQPKDWRRQRFELQKKIVARQRELGITPVLSAFAGHIPEALEKLWIAKGKSIKVHRGKTIDEGWCGFAPTTLLDASDPLFTVIGKRFLELQKDAFGSNSIYSCDTFNEMHVPFTDAASLKASSKAVIDGMMLADPDAVWLMQGWLFLFSRYWWPERIKAYLSGVPNDRMIVLDLFAEKRALWDVTNSFHGKPWIWCQLLNFGGNHGMYGNMTRVAVEPARALKESPSFLGTGMSMESIERNPVLFSMLADTVWTDAPLDIEKWLRQYIASRYLTAVTDKGVERGVEALLPAWQLLNISVYHFNGQLVKSVIEERPIFRTLPEWQPPPYQPADVLEALRVFVLALETQSVRPNGPFLQDLTDLGRQVFSDLFTDFFIWFETLFTLQASQSMVQVQKIMLGLLDDMDELLATNVNYMLGPVMQESYSVGGRETELQVRNILTLWGDGKILNDYASKQWSPLVKDYYKKRWELFLDSMIGAHSLATFAYRDAANILEQAYYRQTKVEPIVPVGDTVDCVKALLKKYADADAIIKYVRHEGLRPQRRFMLLQSWSRDVGVLLTMCEMTPMCGGFTSTGILFAPDAIFEHQEEGSSSSLYDLNMASYVKPAAELDPKSVRGTYEQKDQAKMALMMGGIIAIMVLFLGFILFALIRARKKVKKNY